MKKREVIWIILCILLVNNVNAINVDWPSAVPYGISYHEKLYADLI